jgi:hypothetical protein
MDESRVADTDAFFLAAMWRKIGHYETESFCRELLATPRAGA